MIRRESINSLTYSDPHTSKKNEKNVVLNILHIKCPAVCLVKHQIQNLNAKIIDELAEIKRCKSLGNRLWRQKFTVLLVLLPFLLWLALVYGAISGAALCGGSTCDGSSKRNLIY